MIDNNNLIKYFVRVPVGVSFNGIEVSNANSTNQKKIYFDENTQQIGVKGKAFSLDKANATNLATLIGEDTNMSVRAIAQDVVNNIASWQGADANEIIDTLKEVLTWFNNLPEGDAGALALVQKVGNAAVYYTAEEAAAYNTEHELNEGDEGYKTTLSVKTTATGLYKVIEDSINNAVGSIDYSSFATKTGVEERLGALGNAVEASGNDPAVKHTVKSYVESYVDVNFSYVDSKIGDLGYQVEAQAAVYYTQEEADAYNTEHSLNSGDNGFVTTETIKTPAVTAIPYTNVMDVIKDNELVTAASLNELNDRVEMLSGGGLIGVEIAGINGTVTNNIAYVTKVDLQNELFTNTYNSSPLSYSYLGVTVSLKESNGELTYLNVNPTDLVNRISVVEEFDPWEEYSDPWEEYPVSQP